MNDMFSADGSDLICANCLFAGLQFTEIFVDPIDSVSLVLESPSRLIVFGNVGYKQN